MPENARHQTLSQFPMTVTLFGPLRPASALQRRTNRVMKAHSGGQDHFTEITLLDGSNRGGMVVKYYVRAASPRTAKRVGLVYLSQLCDLLSAVTQCAVRLSLQEEEAREELTRRHRETVQVNRVVTEEEWSWVTGSLVALRREHPRFLAAASWFRKGLNGNDALDDFCCFWRTIERLAEHYADRSGWAEGDGGVRKCIRQLTDDLFHDQDGIPELLRDADRVKRVVKMRNDISHGNEPVTVDMIETASEELTALEEAAFTVLVRIRHMRLTFGA
ncbi:MAG: hypothetical protein WDZ59_14330 [Pirellulales bacterium]